MEHYPVHVPMPHFLHYRDLFKNARLDFSWLQVASLLLLIVLVREVLLYLRAEPIFAYCALQPKGERRGKMTPFHFLLWPFVP